MFLLGKFIPRKLTVQLVCPKFSRKIKKEDNQAQEKEKRPTLWPSSVTKGLAVRKPGNPRKIKETGLDAQQISSVTDLLSVKNSFTLSEASYEIVWRHSHGTVKDEPWIIFSL